MVIVEHSRDGRWIRIQARSHFSLGIGGLLALIISLSGVTLLLAAVAAWQGYWPILAIAILQVALLCVVLVRAWKAAWTVETVTIGPDSIAILQERYAKSKRLELETAWARVILEKPAIGWYAPVLWLRSGHSRIELGAYLNAAEKSDLAESLRAAISAHSAWQHQKIEGD